MEVQESNYLKSSLKHKRGHNNHCMDSKKQVKWKFLIYKKKKKRKTSRFKKGWSKFKINNMEKEKESHKIQLNKITIISACTDGYARLTRLIGRLVKHQPYRNLTSRILTRSFAQNCNKPKWVKTRGYITYLVTSNKHVFAAYTVSF